MTLRSKQEAYAKLVAERSAVSESDKLQAMAEAGYKSDSPINAKRQLKNLEKNQDVQNRIAELQAIRICKDGEPKDTDTQQAKEIASALEFFETIYEDKNQPLKSRLECAESALPFEFAAHGKQCKALKVLQSVYKHQDHDLKNRVRSAKVSVNYEEADQKLGKKEQAKKDAEKLSSNSPYATLNNQLDMYSPDSVQ